ncbi:MAG: hypothetical protein MO846_01210 [Candidatus Devosia symbiotica]|nr:hypothetical protein [Candidatus Devosia symbiotica]
MATGKPAKLTACRQAWIWRCSISPSIPSPIGRSVRTLQTALGVRVDGAVGPLTLNAIKTRIALEGAAGLIDALCDRGRSISRFIHPNQSE